MIKCNVCGQQLESYIGLADHYLMFHYQVKHPFGNASKSTIEWAKQTKSKYNNSAKSVSVNRKPINSVMRTPKKLVSDCDHKNERICLICGLPIGKLDIFHCSC